MITNLIYFLYNIKVDYIRRKNNSYIFSFNNAFYIFKDTFMIEENVVFLNNFINDRVMFHSLIKNRYSKYLSRFNDKYYILMKVKFNMNRLLLLEDIYNTNNYNISYVSRNDFNWVKLWKRKIDQVEEYINNNYINTYNLSIINYFLNLSELAVSYFYNNVKLDVFPITLCHKRISKDSDLYDYFSITDVVFDHYIRDVAEYIKCDIYDDNEIDLGKYNILKNIKDKELLISRLLFPSYFFDVMDDLIINNRDFCDFSRYFINFEVYVNNLLKIINFLR